MSVNWEEIRDTCKKENEDGSVNTERPSNIAELDAMLDEKNVVDKLEWYLQASYTHAYGRAYRKGRNVTQKQKRVRDKAFLDALAEKLLEAGIEVPDINTF